MDNIYNLFNNWNLELDKLANVLEVRNYETEKHQDEGTTITQINDDLKDTTNRLHEALLSIIVGIAGKIQESQDKVMFICSLAQQNSTVVKTECTLAKGTHNNRAD